MQNEVSPLKECLPPPVFGFTSFLTLYFVAGGGQLKNYKNEIKIVSSLKNMSLISINEQKTHLKIKHLTGGELLLVNSPGRCREKRNPQPTRAGLWAVAVERVVRVPHVRLRPDSQSSCGGTECDRSGRRSNASLSPCELA